MAAKSDHPTAIADGINGRFEGFVADKAVFGAYAEEGIWSPEVLHFFTQMLDRWAAQGQFATYIDAGANIGLTLIPFVKRSDLTAAYAIEADPDNAELLRANLRHNSVNDKVTVIEGAVYDKATTLSFERAQDNFGDHRIQGDGAGEMAEASRATIRVKARPIDELINPNTLSGPLLLKSDLQGAEAMLFRGGAKLMTKVDIALIEYWPYGMARLGEDERACRTLIEQYFSHGALLWPHDPQADPDWRPLADIFAQIDSIFGGGDTELHRTGCLNLALAKEPHE
ncbi:MAG: FkbM family methyltransferase [Alphaproteobacteria bacterium]